MMRSMFSGVSSLRVHQTRMDVIANNIANVNTTGFKSQRANFTDAFYQNVMGASGPSAETGRAGTNPQQIGLGVSMGAIDNIMTQGASLRTDIATDVMIQGNGFFIVGDARGTFFTRAGNINEDFHGNLHINGMQLMGWGTRFDPGTGTYVVDRSSLGPLSIGGDKRNAPAEPTTLIDLIGNLNSAMLEPIPGPGDFRGVVRTMRIYDSAGNFYSVDVRFILHEVVETTDNPAHTYWTFEFLTATHDTTPPVSGVAAWFNGERVTPARPDVTPALLAINMVGDMLLPAAADDDFISFGTIAFDNRGNFVGIGTAHLDTAGTPTGGTNMTPGLRPIAFTTDPRVSQEAAAGTWLNSPEFFKQVRPVRGQDPAFAPVASFGTPDPNETRIDVHYDAGGNAVFPIGRININASALGNRGGMNTTIQVDVRNGGGPGVLDEIGIGADGTITGRFTNGAMRVLGQIPVAIFRNPAGLERMGANLWAESANSGRFDGIGQAGNLLGGALEGSNVDLAGQFTDMITTQRGFQAASRTISVSDEMLQELVNLRR